MTAMPSDSDWEEPEQSSRQETERLHLYRLGVLVVAWGNAVDVVSPEDIEGLECLAGCSGDLHLMVRAFGQGCTIGQALGIWL